MEDADEKANEETNADGGLWFTFDPACRDAKFGAGDFLLVLTPEDEPERLLGDVDGALFDPSRWRHAPYQVTLLDYDLTADPPRVRLKPHNLDRLREKVDLSKPCVLDALYLDFNTPKVFDVLGRLQETPTAARHVLDLVATGTARTWTPSFSDASASEAALRHRLRAAGFDPDRLLNAGQWQAFRGVFQEPLTLIWGPPGTGKTHTIAHILLGYALAARAANRPVRVLVTAFTHHAIANVLRKTADLATAYGFDVDELFIAKVGRTHEADDGLPARVERLSEKEVPDHLAGEASCVLLGATVWSAYKAGRDAGSPVQPWFDVVLVDEASQMKLPDALLAFSLTRDSSNIILAGDDRQLPPIIHGTYPEEHAPVLTSVFAFMRHRMEERRDTEPDVERRMLFQLEENFRLNEPLTAYPRAVLYRGRFHAHHPTRRIRLAGPFSSDADDPMALLLHPERPVVLVTYVAPRSYTARNPLEADLMARLVARLSETLVDEATGVVYEPEAFAAEGVAVLAPHRAQNGTIRQALARHGFGEGKKPLPLVDTVDKLQGQERDVVFVSYGVADAEYAEAEAEFLLSSNRFNVAATRARRKLIVVCSEAVLDVVPPDRAVLLDAMMLKEFRRYCADGPAALPWTPGEDEEGEEGITLNVRWKGFEGCG